MAKRITHQTRVANRLGLKQAAAALCALPVFLLPVTAETPAPKDTPSEVQSASDLAASAFERLKTLEGSWHKAGAPDHGLRISFYLTAGGSVLVEDWQYKGRSHSLTLYHRDGDALLATHYCPQGNQPRMALVSGPGVAFTFRDATDLDVSREQVQHDLRFEWGEDGQLIRSEIYRDGEGADHPGKLVLERLVE